MLNDPICKDSGNLPLTLHSLKTPSESNTMLHEIAKTHPQFETNLFIHMNPTSSKFRNQRNRNYDQNVAYACEQVSLHFFWHLKNCTSFNFTLIFSNIL